LSEESKMNDTYLEMIELKGGEFALRRANSEDVPLVTIQFSDEAKELMLGEGSEIAKVMVNAGVQAVAVAYQSRSEAEKKYRVVH